MRRSFKDLRLAEIGSNKYFARVWNALLSRLDEERIDVASPLKIERHATGAVIKLPLRPNSTGGTSGGGVAAGKVIWNPYQHTPDPEDPQTSDWRTVRVSRGLINNIYPDNTTNPDDPDGDGADIILGASETNHFWFECTVSAAIDETEGTITAVILNNGTIWWSGYPSQPTNPDVLTTGAPANKFYIALYDIITSSDDDKILTFPTTWGDNNWWVDMLTFGNPIFDDDGNCIFMQRMSQGVV